MWRINFFRFINNGSRKTTKFVSSASSMFGRRLRDSEHLTAKNVKIARFLPWSENMNKICYKVYAAYIKNKLILSIQKNVPSTFI
jgi:hypothetical protein